MPIATPSSDLSRFEHELSQAGIRVTAVRLLVWRTVREELQPGLRHDGFRGAAFSLADLRDRLYTVDKSTLFRTLTLLAEQGLLHTIDDGSGMQKYCVCHCQDDEVEGSAPLLVHHHGHVHLTCVKCRKTWCLEEVEIPEVDVPDDFEVMEREYVIKGVCKKCRTGWR